MRIGELSRRSGVSVRMLRYYETQGLLNPRRTDSGYRIYGDVEVEMVTRIQALNTAGLTLDTIRRILPCAKLGGLSFHPCEEFKRSLHRKLTELDDRISTLQDGRLALSELLSTSNAADSSRTKSSGA